MIAKIKSPLAVLILLFAAFVAKHLLFGGVGVPPGNAQTTGEKASSGVSIDNQTEKEYNYAKLLPPVAEMMKEKAFGDEKAPVTLNIFSSFGCGHCGMFHEDAVADLMENEVKDGKLRIIFKDFPLDPASLRATMITKCAKPENFLKLIDRIFADQMKWGYKGQFERIFESYSDLTGLDAETFQACITYRELKDAIKAEFDKNADNFDIKATPTLVFQKSIRFHKKEGALSYGEIKEILDRLSKNLSVD